MSHTKNAHGREIAKNTIFLYFRMLFSLGVALYTSRVVLDILGVEDFGIYNVVGGIIILMGFLNNAMAASTQRFMSFALGKGDRSQFRKIFSTSINIHLLIGVVVLVLAETIGLWFLKSKLSIPEYRENAAFWVYQMSVITFLANIINVPYNAAIISHENMKAYSVLSIVETILKLFCVLSLNFFHQDKLILYSVLLALVAFLIRILYTFYCRVRYKDCTYVWFWDKKLILEMSSFANWNLLGVLAGVGYNHGVNILLNIFFGPTINAARGIAFQVQNAVNNFVINLQLAITPPITKAYANEDNEFMYMLVFRSTKFIFFLLLVICLPLISTMEFILSIWLKSIPNFAIIFCKLILIDILINSLSGSLQATAQATGRIKLYQIVVSGILLLNLPISYLCLKNGLGANITFYISIFLSGLALFGRLWVLNRIINFPIHKFIKQVLIPVSVVSIISVFVIRSCTNMLTNQFILLVGVGVITLLIVILFGLTKSEKLIIIDKLKFKKLFNEVI